MRLSTIIGRINRLPNNDYFKAKVSDYLKNNSDELARNGWEFIIFEFGSLNFGKIVDRVIGSHYLKSFKSLGFKIKMEEVPNGEEFYSFKRLKDKVKFTLGTHYNEDFIDMLLKMPANSEDVDKLFI